MFRFLRSFDLERKLVSRFPERLRQRFAVGDHFAARFMERHGVTILRVALAVVFIWFGALKVLDLSPVKEIVKETVFFLPGNTFFFLLGLAEIVIGVGLLIPIALRVTLVLFWLQMGGTFLTLAVLPELAFQGGNPLLLSVLGEFVVKNIVLIAAGLVIGASIHRRAKPHHASFSNDSIPQSGKEKLQGPTRSSTGAQPGARPGAEWNATMQWLPGYRTERADMHKDPARSTRAA